MAGDPGADAMFDDRMYERGAPALHALRLVVGDEEFVDVLRAWTERHRHPSASTVDLIALAEEVTGRALLGHLRPWPSERGLPRLSERGLPADATPITEVILIPRGRSQRCARTGPVLHADVSAVPDPATLLCAGAAVCGR